MNNIASNEFWSIVVGGTLLSINAGFINVVTLAGVFSVTVSHVTGNVTRIGISLFQRDFGTLALVTSIVFSFMFGSFIAGFMVGDNKFKLGKGYGYALLLEAMALFGSFLFLKRELVIGEWCAAFGCGLQNALATSYSGAVVRTTHMTGVCTDIANIFGQYCRKDSSAEMWRLKVHIPLLLGFIFGGILGQAAFLLMKENALLLPCFFVGLIGSTYLSLPFVQKARAIYKNDKKDFHGQKAVAEVRRLGDPRRSTGGDVDFQINNLMQDMDIIPPLKDRRVTKESSFEDVQTTGMNVGGGTEMIFLTSKEFHEQT